ncbi:hypothetical protein PLACP1_07610 [Planifilum fimeticola]
MFKWIRVTFKTFTLPNLSVVLYHTPDNTSSSKWKKEKVRPLQNLLEVHLGAGVAGDGSGENGEWAKSE